jgi:hypothetical protein
MSRDSARTWDLVVGIAACLMGCLGFFVSLLLGGLGAALGLAGIVDALKSGPVGALIGGAIGGIFIVIAIIAGLQFTGGVGVIRGRRWGFGVTLMVCGIAALGALSAGDIFGAGINGAMCAYCFTRLSGRLGAKP